VALDPKYAEGYLKLASIQSCDDPVQSITDCNKALQLEPNSLIARIERAKAFAYNGLLQEADKDLSIVLAQAPECKLALFDRAQCALALHHTDRALEDINKLMLLSKQSASRKDEKNPGAAMQGTLKQYDFRACAYFIDKNYAKALADCNQCIKLATEAHAPPSLKTYLVRAAVYRAMGNDQGAVQDFTRVLEKYPGNEELYLARGGCYLQMKQYQKALKDFKKVGEDSGAAGFAHYWQSECLLKLGQKPLALQELQKSQKLGYVPESGLTAPTGKVKPGSPIGFPAQLDKKLELWIIKHK
jgi:tetratricopeptide (TPR) repeat protein